ncbi:MAG: SRPBCC family protein [Acidimicrobiia bacterium]
MRLQSFGHFDVALPAADAIGLFTPEGERAWVPGWDPAYPARQPSEDSGTVFVTISDGVETAWVVLEIDRSGATAAYARITLGHHAGVVRVGCTDTAAGHSTVSVTYDLTLLGNDPAELDAHADDRFELMMKAWSDAIAAHLGGPTV